MRSIIPTLGSFSIGHFKPIPSNRYLNNFYEFIFHFTKKGDVKLDKLAIGVPYQDKSNVRRWMFTNKDILASDILSMFKSTSYSTARSYYYPSSPNVVHLSFSLVLLGCVLVLLLGAGCVLVLLM